MTGTPAASGRWGDLRNRALSGVVMIVVGALAIWLGGGVFAALVIVLSAVMIWELALMTAPGSRSTTPLALAGFAGLCQACAIGFGGVLAAILVLAPAVSMMMTQRREQKIATAYAACVMIAGYGLVHLRSEGVAGIVWLLSVVVISDIAGYFVGRIVGGPKFWPAISPKKTWSGTVAGWLGAVAVSLVFVLAGQAHWSLLVLAPVVSLAGQLGDIAESWIKRRTGVKDSSRLIPGHGGFLDRFDAVTGAIVLIMILSLFARLPIPMTLGG